MSQTNTKKKVATSNSKQKRSPSKQSNVKKKQNLQNSRSSKNKTVSKTKAASKKVHNKRQQQNSQKQPSILKDLLLVSIMVGIVVAVLMQNKSLIFATPGAQNPVKTDQKQAETEVVTTLPENLIQDYKSIFSLTEIVPKEGFLSTFQQTVTDNAITYMTDGTDKIEVLDAQGSQTGKLSISYKDKPITGIDTLILLNGRIYAGIKGTCQIAVITPDGDVESIIDFSALIEKYLDADSKIMLDQIGLADNKICLSGDNCPYVFCFAKK